MNGVLSGYLTRIKSVLEDQSIGLIESKEIFNFDSIPSTLMDGIYRIEVEAVENKLAEKGSCKYRTEATVLIYIGYKLTARGNRTDEYLEAMDNIENIESGLCDEFPEIMEPILRLDSFKTSEYSENYLIVLYQCQLTYWRSF